jgi:uncharacterized damage-inducible protein DinB
MFADPIPPYRGFAYNNAWANYRLISACAALSPREFEAPRTGFFPSLQLTLNHIYCIDLFYIDALEGGLLGPAAWANKVPYASVAALKLAQARLDQRLIAICETLSCEQLGAPVRINRDPEIQIERRDRLLLHLFQHQIHHRGQAHAMLAATRVAPPQLDEFFSAMDAPRRAGEFAELGWTEDSIWRPCPHP